MDVSEPGAAVRQSQPAPWQLLEGGGRWSWDSSAGCIHVAVTHPCLYIVVPTNLGTQAAVGRAVTWWEQIHPGRSVWGGCWQGRAACTSRGRGDMPFVGCRPQITASSPSALQHM